MSDKKLLLVDDDQDFLETMAFELEGFGYLVFCAQGQVDVDTFIKDNSYLDYAIVDLRIGNESGLSIIPCIRDAFPKAKITMLTAFGSIASTVEAMKRGSDNYLMKPCSTQEILAALNSDSQHEQENTSDEVPDLYRKEREYIDYILQMNNGNISQTAKALGIKRQSLQRKLKKFIPNPKD